MLRVVHVDMILATAAQRIPADRRETTGLFQQLALWQV